MIKNTEQDNCPICNGIGYLPVPDDPYSRIRCRCTLRALYRNKLGSEIFEADALEDSEFADLVNKSLFVTSTRRDFLPHLRYSLIDQGLGYFGRVTNDNQMLDAWLSKERAHSQDEGTADSKDFTSLRDLVEGPQLLVIFLCIVSYRNKALPGVLLESLRIRNFEGLPTWIINPHAHPFNRGHLCYSPEVEEYIAENFSQTTIKPTRKTKKLHEGIIMRETEGNDSDGNKVTRKKADIDFSKFGM